MADYDENKIRKVATALLVGLQRQGEQGDGPAIYDWSGDEESIGIDGRLNLWLLAQCAIDALDPD